MVLCMASLCLSVSLFAGAGLYLNDTLGCDIHRGISFAGQPIGGECCKAKDTFQLCTGDVANTTTLTCANATSHTLSDGQVTLGWSAEALGGTPTSVRYAYANFPQCALYNKYHLPASPFVAKLQTADSVAAAQAMPSAPAGGVCKTPPDGRQLLERVPLQRGRAEDARDGRCACFDGAGKGRVRVHQHRRLLAGDALSLSLSLSLSHSLSLTHTHSLSLSLTLGDAGR